MALAEAINNNKTAGAAVQVCTPAHSEQERVKPQKIKDAIQN